MKIGANVVYPERIVFRRNHMSSEKGFEIVVSHCLNGPITNLKFAMLCSNLFCDWPIQTMRTKDFELCYGTIFASQTTYYRVCIKCLWIQNKEYFGRQVFKWFTFEVKACPIRAVLTRTHQTVYQIIHIIVVGFVVVVERHLPQHALQRHQFPLFASKRTQGIPFKLWKDLFHSPIGSIAFVLNTIWLEPISLWRVFWPLV